MYRRLVVMVRPFFIALLVLRLSGWGVSTGHAAGPRPADEAPAVAAARAALEREYARLEAAFRLRDKDAVARAVRPLLAPGFTSDLTPAVGEPGGPGAGTGGHAPRFISWVTQGGAGTPSPTVSFLRVLDLSARAHATVGRIEVGATGATVDVTFEIRKDSRGTLAAEGAGGEEIWANGVRWESVQRHVWVRRGRGWKLRRVQVVSATATSSLFPASPPEPAAPPPQP